MVWIENIIVVDKTVSFRVNITGEYWTVQLRNSVGNVLATTSGYSYGTFTIQMPDNAPSGTYTLWCIPSYSGASQNGTDFIYTGGPGPRMQTNILVVLGAAVIGYYYFMRGK